MDALADGLVHGLLGLEHGAPASRALASFVRDLLVVAVLLVVVTHLMALANALFPVERVREVVASGRLRGAEHLLASAVGAVTPFCSCSSVPLFLGFLEGGIPLGVTFSFLITSPLVNEVALAIFLGTFGWKVTLLYAGAGVLLGTVLGAALGRLGLERYVEEWVRKAGGEAGAPRSSPGPARALPDLLRRVSRHAIGVTAEVGPYVVAGVAVGAAVHGWVPAGALRGWMGAGNPLAVPAAVAASVPMYAGAASAIPVMEALVAKGVPLGTALAFMMGVVGLSLPEALMLRKVLRPRLLATFFGSVAVSIVLVGYGFNLLL